MLHKRNVKHHDKQNYTKGDYRLSRKNKARRRQSYEEMIRLSKGKMVITIAGKLGREGEDATEMITGQLEKLSIDSVTPLGSED
eukprot:759913-Hanusia_phi.AAC.1